MKNKVLIRSDDALYSGPKIRFCLESWKRLGHVVSDSWQKISTRKKA